MNKPSPVKDYVTAWDAQHLRQMLLDQDYIPPPLWLKPLSKDQPETRRVEIRRHPLENSKSAIEKRYRGNLSARQREEFVSYMAVHRTTSVKSHFPAFLNYATKSATLPDGPEKEILLTQWEGFNVPDWRILLGDSSPLKKSIPCVLSLVHGLLEACELFHEMGFVHSDLMIQNFLIGFKLNDDKTGGVLYIGKPKLMDLEFCLRPIDKSDKYWGEGSHRLPWFYEADEQGWQEPIVLGREYHSEQLVLPELEKKPFLEECKETGDKKLVYQWGVKRDQLNGQVVWRKPDFKHVTWTADFFSLGCLVKNLIDGENFEPEDNHSKAYKKEDDYLRDLPERLKAYDAKPPVAGVYPHRKLINEIKGMIDVKRFDTVEFVLPALPVSPAPPVPPAPPTIAPPEPEPVPTTPKVSPWQSISTWWESLPEWSSLSLMLVGGVVGWFFIVLPLFGLPLAQGMSRIPGIFWGGMKYDWNSSVPFLMSLVFCLAMWMDSGKNRFYWVWGLFATFFVACWGIGAYDIFVSDIYPWAKFKYQTYTLPPAQAKLEELHYFAKNSTSSKVQLTPSASAYRVGEPMTFVLSSAREGYVNVLMQDEGKTTAAAVFKDIHITAAQPLTLPVGGLHFVAQPPAGKMRMVALVTPKKLEWADAIDLTRLNVQEIPVENDFSYSAGEVVTVEVKP